MKSQVSAFSAVVLVGLVVIPFKCEALKCPGKCTSNVTDCKARGGKILGYCTKESACCDFTSQYFGSCGDTKSELPTVTFQSPEYPDFNSGDLVCKFVFELNSKIQGIEVEFEGQMEGIGFEPRSGCETDMIFLQGFPKWQPPARCGNISGYGIVIDRRIVQNMKSLTVLAVMSSSKYRWRIKINQLPLETNTPVERNSGEITADSAEIGTSHKVEDFSNPGAHLRASGKAEVAGVMEQQRQSWTDDSGLSSDNENLELEESLIVNGEDTLISEVPWQVSLRMLYRSKFLNEHHLDGKFNRAGFNCSDTNGRHFCGGSIISNQLILSAAHCFYGSSKLRDWRNLSDVNVVLGDTDVCADDKVKYGHASKVYKIEKVLFHYGFDISSYLNDVVVIKLKKKIEFNDRVKSINLSEPDMSYVGKKAKVSGWGKTNLTAYYSRMPYILQSTEEIFVRNQHWCDYDLESMFTESKYVMERFPKYEGAFRSLLCTSYDSYNNSFKVVGPGDSGGPLIIRDVNTQEAIQIGVVSFSVPALKAMATHDNVFVDYFQDVSYFRDWIDSTMLA